MNLTHFRNTRAAARTKRTRRFTLGALGVGVAVLALALIITGMLTTDSADAQMTNTTTIWSTTMTVGTASATSGAVVQDSAGYDTSFGTIGSTQFTYSGTTYSINRLITQKQTVSGTVTANTLSLDMPSLFPTTADSRLVLELDGTRFSLADATRSTNSYAWSSHGLTWDDGDSVAVKLLELPKTSVWSTTMTVGTASATSGAVVQDSAGYDTSFGSIGSTQFTYSGTTYSINRLITQKQTVSGTVTANTLSLDMPSLFPTTADSRLVLELDGTRFSLADATRSTNSYAWSSHGLTWDDGDSVAVKLLELPKTSVWSTTMTVGTASATSGAVVQDSAGYDTSFGSIGSTQFTYSGTTYSVNRLITQKQTVSGTVTANTLSIDPSPLFPTTADSRLVLELDGTRFALADATRSTNSYAWSSHGLTWDEDQSVAVKLTTTDPGVSSIALTSDPNDDSRTGNDDTYAIGDDIEATLTFNQAVDVTGSPQVTLTIGSSEKAASCAAATNTTTVVCSYTVAQGNNAPDGVGVKANSLALNGGTIHRAGSTTFNALLDHAAVAVNSQHKVDGIRPTLITTGADAPRISTDGTQAFLRFSEDLSSADSIAFFIIVVTHGTSGAVSSATINAGDRVTITHNGVLSTNSALTLQIIQGAVTDLVGNTSSQRIQLSIPNTTSEPSAPTDLTASAASTTRINLSWSAPSDAAETGVTGYKIEVSTDAGDNWTVLVSDTNSTDTRYAHTGLDPDDARHYRVSAINPVGTSPESNVASATTLLVNPVVSSGEGTIFVANTGSGNNQNLVITRFNNTRRAQAFTTGPAGAGYVLGSIGIRFSQIVSPSTAGRDLVVTLNEEGSSGNPGSSLCTLIDPSAFDDHAVNTFTAPTTGENICPVLQASTTYFVVVKRVDGRSNQTDFIHLTGTTRDAEDSQADRTRWSIADQSWHRGSSNWNTRTEVVKLDIRGGYVPSLTAIGAIADESGDPDTSTTLTFQIFLDQKVKHNVSVDYATQDGTAKAGVNYTHTSGTVTFAPREQVKTVDVDILEDSRGGSTYFKLVLSNPKGAGLRNNHQGTGRILDTLPRFRTWDASASEGNTTISFVVEFNHREPGDTADYTVDYRTEDITATAGADYVSTSGTLTFTPADGDLVVPVTIKDDDIQDNGETFRLVLSNPSSGVTLHRTAATAIGTILNHDSEGLTATFPASAYASKSHKGPNDRPQVVVAFNSSVASISATTPSVVVNGASITSVQAHTEDGLLNAQIFILEPDGNDDITFTLVANVACASGGICSGTGTPITQVPSSHTIPAKQTATASQLSVADAAASEEDDSTIDFIVTLSPASDESVTVDYATANGSASTGDDYTAASGSLTFNAGETSKTIQVSIIDDTVVDNNETLTITLSNASGAEISDGQATGAITDGDTESVPLTAAFQDLPDSHDGSTAFTFRVLFSEDVGISYVNMRDDAFSLSEGDVTGARRVDGRSDLWEITVEPDGNSGVGITLPANRSCTTTGAICTREDSPRQLTNNPTATVTGPAEAPPTNTPAAGAPTISGTPQVEQTLTADTSSITDEDGLDNVSYAYQWVRNDGTDDADIAGETGSTYTLVDADQGQTIKVKVTFTDDAGNDESLTSAATVAVLARPNRAAAGLPTISGTPQVEQTLTADTSGISDEDGLSNVSYTYQWIAGGTDISGATGTSYTPTADEEGLAIQVWVSFEDDAGHAETLTSAATLAVAPKPTPLTASFSNMPSSHDGSTEFTFDLTFSENFPISYVTLRDHAFTEDDNGPITKAQRKIQGSNQTWTITVDPKGNGAITITLPETTDCNADGAICTDDGRKLSHFTTVTVSGPG